MIVCPGGQAEMVYTHLAFRPKRQIVLHTRHKGFCRLAIEQGAHLVPALAMGETLQMKNLFDWPVLQQYTCRRFGFPFPYCMVGRWGFSPFPRKVPLKYFIGDPIAPPRHMPSKSMLFSDWRTYGPT